MKQQIHHLLSIVIAIGLIDVAILLLIVIIWASVHFFVGRPERRLQRLQELEKELLYR